MILEAGKVYDLDALVFTGWTDGDGSGAMGYNVQHYFVAVGRSGGRYLGPDICGIEPIFEDAP